jgi:tetratricopeptide (TPR) repeat protein
MTEQQPDRRADDAVHALLGEAKALAAHDPGAALALLEKSPAPGHGLYHHAFGALCMRVGRIHDAIAAFEQAVKILPEVADLKANLGSALLARARPMKAGDPPLLTDVERACAVLQEAVAGRPLFAEAGATLVLALELLGRADEAVIVADNNLARFPDDPGTLINKASALKALGRRNDARSSLQRMLARHPDHPAAGAAQVALGRLD